MWAALWETRCQSEPIHFDCGFLYKVIVNWQIYDHLTSSTISSYRRTLVCVYLTKYNIQSFSLLGHKATVKCMCVPDDEQFFFSASKDRTVKIWSLRNRGDDIEMYNCQLTYTEHQRPLLGVQYVHNLQQVISCDSVLHVRYGKVDTIDHLICYSCGILRRVIAYVKCLLLLKASCLLLWPLCQWHFSHWLPWEHQIHSYSFWMFVANVWSINGK